jgi:MoxR-like ATPase
MTDQSPDTDAGRPPIDPEEAALAAGEAPLHSAGEAPVHAAGEAPVPDGEPPAPEPLPGDVERARRLAEARDAIRAEIGRVIVGQHAVIDLLLVALFARGHSVFIGVPGLAKTLLVSTLARVTSLSFQRIQFTPDLMPSDITGTDVLEEDRATGRRSFRFVQGPLFANLLLADEVNRTPPKTQAALLQAMQEGEVTAGGRTHPLPEPFLVFATQNPIEHEGTYPLPEAQLDRFMLSVDVGYPSAEEEEQIVRTTTSPGIPELRHVLDVEDIRGFQALVRRVPISDRLTNLAVRMVRATRPQDASSGEFVREWVEWGAGPRASQYLVLGAKARAVLMGRFAVAEEDLRALAPSVLRHRVVVNFRAEADRITPDTIVGRATASLRS